MVIYLCRGSFLPDAVGEGDAAGRQQQDRPPAEAIAEAADDRRGNELEEGEERPEEAAEQHRDEGVGSSDQGTKVLHIRLLREVVRGFLQPFY